MHSEVIPVGGHAFIPGAPTIGTSTGATAVRPRSGSERGHGCNMTLAPYAQRRRRGGWPLAPGFRRDPYREMEDINNRFNQLIQTFFGDMPGLTSPGGWSAIAPIDVEETDDAYIVDINVPSMNPAETTIEMRGEELRVTGRFQERERAGVVRRQNRPEGDFEYLVDLPSDIDPDRVEATYENGVLTVTVGKKRDAQPRRIEIRAGQDGQQSGQGNGQQATGRGQRNGRETAQRASGTRSQRS
jgi:HSP20 family protein